MMLTFLIAIAAFIIVSAAYIKHDSLRDSKPDVIVVLSGDYDWDTRYRVQAALKLAIAFPGIEIMLCGRDKAAFMRRTIKAAGYAGLWRSQDTSTNTEEDAAFTKKILGGQSKRLILVTSGSHQRRSYHTFQRAYPEAVIFNAPTNDWLNRYSPFLPLAWFGMVMNIYKDWLYNRRF